MLLAHSAKPERGVTAQGYHEHIIQAREWALDNARAAGEYSPQYASLLHAVVGLAAEYHDMGKLDAANQEVLRGEIKSRRLPINHVDAGAAHLLLQAGASNKLAAMVAYAHHRGLASIPAENAKKCVRKELWFRDGKSQIESTHQALVDFTNEHLPAYLAAHRSGIPDLSLSCSDKPQLETLNLFLRMALSCMVDGDHGDSARHEGAPVADALPLRAAERLQSLDAYVRGLTPTTPDDRSRMRAGIYQACRDADPLPAIYSCMSPVGTGKTTAVMAHLLRAAVEKKLRRVFVVLPFTNIVTQSVERYRKSLVLDGERSEEIVAAHHHRSDYPHRDARQYTELWHAPIVVTTAVQFFETLASNQPGALRKLHQTAGSAIFIDESHAALPAHLWPQTLRWLKELTESWGCHLVLGSGTQTRLWELPDFIEPAWTLPELLPASLAADAIQSEQTRVAIETAPAIFGAVELTDRVRKAPGPRLLILNTVQSAAVIARELATALGQARVEHLSTALCPADREVALKRVQVRLKNPDDKDWVLVATSCVEAGVELSFRTGFRERASLMSLLQTAGRVRRDSEAAFQDAKLLDFRLRHEGLLRRHPAFDISATVLEQLFLEGRIGPEHCREALKREVRQQVNGTSKAEPLLKAERGQDFPEVEKLYRVIDSDTFSCVVNPDLVRKLESHEQITPRDLQDHSVQIWSYKLQDWAVREIPGSGGLLAWNLAYDPFLGYMVGALEVESIKRGDAAIV